MSKSKIQNKVLLFVICISFAICHLPFAIYAQDNNQLVTLTKQIIEAKSNEELYVPFAELKDLYLAEHKYADFVEYLKSLIAKKETLGPFVNYYIALSRYHQLKYLQETQNWEEYFNQGNSYRDEITSKTQKTIDATSLKDTLHIYSKLLLWQFYKDEQYTSAQDLLSDLMISVLGYAKEAKDIKPIKEAADRLLADGEKAKSKELYRIYVEKLFASEVKDNELNSLALRFYKEGNLELAEATYDVYIERIAKAVGSERLIPILADIARLFSFGTDSQLKDPFYAEKYFEKMEGLGGKDVFNEQLIYLRAYNLEKSKEYTKAKDYYIDLVKRFPKAAHADEADFKVAVIYTYILRDKKSGRRFFERLAEKEILSPQGSSSLYQLGLLSQWEENSENAKKYYHNLLEKAGQGFPETAAKGLERLREIEEQKPIEYNLKIFLDAALKEEYAYLDATKIDLRASAYKLKRQEAVKINATSYPPESGCMPVELLYLWSGDLGTAKLESGQSAFDTTYTQPGTKILNLVVVSPTGIIDRNIEMLDVE